MEIVRGRNLWGLRMENRLGIGCLLGWLSRQIEFLILAVCLWGLCWVLEILLGVVDSWELRGGVCIIGFIYLELSFRRWGVDKYQ